MGVDLAMEWKRFKLYDALIPAHHPARELSDSESEAYPSDSASTALKDVTGKTPDGEPDPLWEKLEKDSFSEEIQVVKFVRRVTLASQDMAVDHKPPSSLQDVDSDSDCVIIGDSDSDDSSDDEWSETEERCVYASYWTVTCTADTYHDL